MDRSVDSPLAVIRSAIAELRGTLVIDIGCGEGGLARQLVDQGARVTGIDPFPQAIDKARAKVPEARFEIATAEALPFEDRAFQLAVMVNSLHHVPAALMDVALREARRVLQKDGTLIVIEPAACGNFFNAMRRIEDETEIRRQAQVALSVARSLFATHRTLNYVRRETYDTARQFVDRIIAVDPARQSVFDAQRDTVLAEVRQAAIRTDDGALAFDQPIKADIFSDAL